MLTLEQILKSSDPRILNKLDKYKLNAFQTQNNEDYIRFLAQIIGGSEPRQCTINFYNGVEVISPVLIYCSCDYFKYNLEIALVARGSATQLHANNTYPQKKNPGFKPGLCVHLALLARTALSSVKSSKNNMKIKPKISPKLK